MSAVLAQPVIGANDTVRCPGDDYDFRPYYSGGGCPLCGWTPTGAVVARPWSQRVDWLLIGFAALVVFAILMTIAVLSRL